MCSQEATLHDHLLIMHVSLENPAQKYFSAKSESSALNWI
jgi:hypothetical protein